AGWIRKNRAGTIVAGCPGTASNRRRQGDGQSCSAVPRLAATSDCAASVRRAAIQAWHHARPVVAAVVAGRVAYPVATVVSRKTGSVACHWRFPALSDVPAWQAGAVAPVPVHDSRPHAASRYAVPARSPAVPAMLLRPGVARLARIMTVPLRGVAAGARNPAPVSVPAR